MTTYAYDRQGRVVSKSLPDSTTVSFTYDRSPGASITGRVLIENAMGRLVVMEDASQKKVMSYDDLGRIKKESRSLKKYPILELDPTNFTFERAFVTNYFYDFLDRITIIQYPKKE